MSSVWEVCEESLRCEYDPKFAHARIFVLSKSKKAPEDRSSALGYIVCSPKRKGGLACVVLYVYVNPERRRQGFGALLVRRCPKFMDNVPGTKGLSIVDDLKSELNPHGSVVSVTVILSSPQSASHLSFFCGPCRLRPLELHPDECSVTLETDIDSLQRIRSIFLDTLPMFKCAPLQTCGLLLLATLTKESPEYPVATSIEDKGLLLWRKDVQDLDAVKDGKRYWEQRRAAITRYCRVLLRGQFPKVLRFDVPESSKVPCQMLTADKMHLLHVAVGIIRGDSNEEMVKALDTNSGVLSQHIIDLIKHGSLDLSSLYK